MGVGEDVSVVVSIGVSVVLVSVVLVSVVIVSVVIVSVVVVVSVVELESVVVGTLVVEVVVVVVVGSEQLGAPVPIVRLNVKPLFCCWPKGPNVGPKKMPWATESPKFIDSEDDPASKATENV